MKPNKCGDFLVVFLPKLVMCITFKKKIKSVYLLDFYVTSSCLWLKLSHKLQENVRKFELTGLIWHFYLDTTKIHQLNCYGSIC